MPRAASVRGRGAKLGGSRLVNLKVAGHGDAVGFARRFGRNEAALHVERNRRGSALARIAEAATAAAVGAHDIAGAKVVCALQDRLALTAGAFEIGDRRRAGVATKCAPCRAAGAFDVGAHLALRERSGGTFKPEPAAEFAGA